jgi:hypothetical protein
MQLLLDHEFCEKYIAHNTFGKKAVELGDDFISKRNFAFHAGDVSKALRGQYHQNAVSYLGQPLLEFVCSGVLNKFKIHGDYQIAAAFLVSQIDDKRFQRKKRA